MFPSQPALQPSADATSGVTDTWKPDRVACPPGYMPLGGGGQAGSGEVAGVRNGQHHWAVCKYSSSIPAPGAGKRSESGWRSIQQT